tara:strand:+ start:4911 stop:5402 length:492 start_codon:yes stop_codon:yes gene_type:complete
MVVADKAIKKYPQTTYPRISVICSQGTAHFYNLMRTFIFVSTLLAVPAMAEDIKPFLSDGCSSFPNGTLEQKELWLSCCEAHDYAYWMGGSYQQRLDADNALQQCVAATGEPKIAQLMLAGVRVGGTPFLPTRFRWGYGWPFFRGYQTLSAEDAAQINKLTKP